LQWDVTIQLHPKGVEVRMKGIFHLLDIYGRVIESIPNTIVYEGEQTFFKMLFQGDATFVAAGGNFYLGLCAANLNLQGTVDRTKVLSNLIGEPPISHGYARLPISRDTTGWPNANLVFQQGVWSILSKQVSLTAAGGNIGPVNRMFLATTNDNSGKLLSLSGQFTIPLTISSGQTNNFQYQMFFN
jgi:hypothetical protein